MKNKFLLVVLCVFLICGFAYSQEKHNAGDMLLGIALDGYGYMSTSDLTMLGGLGLTYEYYIFNWLSASGGFFGNGGVVARGTNLGSAEGKATAGGIPFYLQIPLDVHVNIPKVAWIYTGLGFSFDIPLFSMSDTIIGVPASTMASFLAIHGDIGLDFIKKHGWRVLLRVSKSLVNLNEGYYPEPILFGLLMQYNIKIK